ncbi:hypothetical protein M0805_007743 [Coniferiporia weirii]|nr:hypothetical protein M0805_007743 [Coniferiporia weirii]
MRWLLSLLQPVSWIPLLLLPRVSLANPINVTIDDQFGDPTNGQSILYSPSAAWQAGQTCTECKAKVSPASDAYLGTWMDATFNPLGSTANSVPGQIIRASTTFFGTSVYVVCILTGTSSLPNGNTDMTFLIDNTTAGSFQKAPDNGTTYHFNQTVFAQTGLPNALHTITIESGHANQTALVLLDSIIYTVDNSSTALATTLSPITALTISAPSQSASGTPNTGNAEGLTNMALIIGPVIAVVAVLALSIVLFIFLRRRRRSRGDVYTPRCSGMAHGPEVRGVQYVVSGGPLSEYTGSTSVTGYGYPASTSESATGVFTPTRSETISPGGRSDYTRIIPPSEVGGTVFSDGSLLPPYEVNDPVSAVPLPPILRPLPPNPGRKS